MTTEIYINLFLKILCIYINNHKQKFNYLTENIKVNYKCELNNFNKNIKIHNMFSIVNKNNNYFSKTYIINNSFYIDSNSHKKELFDSFIKLIKHTKNNNLIKNIEDSRNNTNSDNKKIYYDVVHKLYSYKFTYTDNNPYEEVIIYKNNKLEKYFAEDSVNQKVWKNNYINNLTNINKKYNLKSLLNLDVNYFNHEFKPLKLELKNQRPFLDGAHHRRLRPGLTFSLLYHSKVMNSALPPNIPVIAPSLWRLLIPSE